MHGTFRCIRPHDATARSSLKAALAKHRTRDQPCVTCPSTFSNVPLRRGISLNSHASSSGSQAWDPDENEFWRPFLWSKGHYIRPKEAPADQKTGDTDAFNKSVKQALEREELRIQPDDLYSWTRLFKSMKEKHGKDGVWACFELLRENRKLYLILQADAGQLRDEIIAAAVAKDTRVETITLIARRLRAFSQEWPELYASVLHCLLKEENYVKAVKWHLHLSRDFPPTSEVFAGLLSGFVHDPKRELQDCLTAMYVFSDQRQLYDHIIPMLYSAGRSRSAQVWANKFVKVQDFPRTSRSRQFLIFIARYFPGHYWSKGELEFVCRKEEVHSDMTDNSDGPQLQHTPMRGIYRDDFVAKWFASSWVPVEFAINFVHRLGLQMIGARSLQALALREPDAATVASRIAQLDKLGIHIAPQTYCKALVFFARNKEDELLRRLLETDVHPDEFDDSHTRRMIRDTAIKQNDTKRDELFQGVEWAIENDMTPHYLNVLLQNILRSKKLGKAKVVMDRMDALKITMTPENAATLLNRVFHGVGSHPTRWRREMARGQQEPHLDRAIYVTRRIASHNVAIPLKYWQNLLFSLGRLGRFEELLELSLEIIKLFRPPGLGLVPVYRTDIPRLPEFVGLRPESRMNADGTLGPRDMTFSIDGEPPQVYEENPGHIKLSTKPEKLEDTQYIPADLTFTRYQHPIWHIFGPKLQRSIIRWGFDQTLDQPPNMMPGSRSSNSSLAEYDIACGVHILAQLRDRGVYIYPQIITSSIFARIVLGEVPQRRHFSRDSQDVSPENVKRLVDKAWGGEILPPLPQLRKEVDMKRESVWKRYPILFRSAYDKERDLDIDM